MSDGPTRAAWMPDPSGRHQHRYFDGKAWTAHVADDGRQSTDADGVQLAASLAGDDILDATSAETREPVPASDAAGSEEDASAAQGAAGSGAVPGPPLAVSSHDTGPVDDPRTAAPEPGSGPRAWIRRRPIVALFLAAGVGLLLGGGMGAAVGNQQSDVDSLEAANSKLKAQVATEATRADITEGQLKDVQDRADRAEAKVKKLAAKGEVPDFVGEDQTSVTESDLVGQYDWRVRTSRQASERQPGTVLAQAPRPGTTLKAGRTITITVAKKPPPKPRQWVTIDTFSGASSTKTDEFTVPGGVKARLEYSMPQDGNNAIILYRAPSEYVDLLLNDIGPQQGTTRLYEPGRFYLDVTGAYTINIQVYKRPS